MRKYAGIGSTIAAIGGKIRTGIKATTPALDTIANKAMTTGANLMNHHSTGHGLAELGMTTGAGLLHGVHALHLATTGLPAGQVIGGPLLAGGSMLARASQRLSKL